MGAWSFKMNMMKSVFCMFHKFHMKGLRVKAVVDGPTGPAKSGPLFRPSMFSAVTLFGAVCLLSPAFSKKSGGTLFLVFRGAWCVVRGAWCVVRGAWRVVRGAWFRVFSGYFVPLTPPTVSVRSF